MAIDIFRPEVVQSMIQSASLGLLVLGLVCNCCKTKIPKLPCPECGCDESEEQYKAKIKKIHRNVTEIFGEDGLPSCGGSANNDEGGGGASTFLSNLFRGTPKKPK